MASEFKPPWKPSEKQARIIEFIRRNANIVFDPNGEQNPYDFIGQHKRRAELLYAENYEPEYDTTLRADEWGGIPNH